MNLKNVHNFTPLSLLKKIGNPLSRIDSSITNLIRKFAPLKIRAWLRLPRYKWITITEPIRIKKNVTKLLGPEYTLDHKKIEIDITYHCNIKCLYCNRFLDLVPVEIHMSTGQIKKFVRESIQLNRKWERIYISGGEPTTHPEIFNMVELLISYKKKFSPTTKIILLTNGVGRKTNDILSILPNDIEIINSRKDLSYQRHFPITIAPIDLKEYKKADFSNGCIIPHSCAMGLNKYGYYQCAVAAAIDRIFGFDLGRKSLPSEHDTMIDLFRTFCRYCGHFHRWTPSTKENITPTWKKALEEYMKSPPNLTPY